MKGQKIQLVLGAGGARGMGHIGVIEELEKAGCEIVEIIGCSMGAVVGGMYAAGRLPEYRDWLLSLKKSDVWSMMDFTITKQGFVKGEKVFKPMSELLGPINIEDLKIPFTAVATNMMDREEVYFSKGDFYQALRASISIPGLFTPVVMDGQVLVDGGVLNPLPVNLIKKREDAITIAVNINAKTLADRNQKEVQEPEPDSKGWLNLQWPFLKKMDPGKDLQNYSVIDLMQTTYEFTQDRLTDAILEIHPPDVVVDIARSTCGLLEFHKAKQIIETGHQCALRDIPGLQQSSENNNRTPTLDKR